MDENVDVITPDHFRAENILCVDGSIEDALQLSSDTGRRYSPLSTDFSTGQNWVLNGNLIFLDDVEFGSLQRALGFENLGNRFGTCEFRHLLNLPNPARDVKFRQEGVRELSFNSDLYDGLDTFLRSAEIFDFYGSRNLSDHRGFSHLLTPENLKKYISGLYTIFEGADSGPLKRVCEWVDRFDEDTILQELVRQKRKVSDARVFAVYSERFKTVRYGLLKPDVRPEDVFDFLEVDMSEYTVEVGTRKKKQETRKVVRYKHPVDGNLILEVLGHSRQRMDVLNDITARNFSLPLFLVHAQLNHIYNGARLYRCLSDTGFPAVFPEITNSYGELNVENILPIRMVLEQIHESVRRKGMSNYSASHAKFSLDSLCPLSFDLSSDDLLVQTEGPNKRGKSEAWRTINLLTAMANAGYPVPADSVRYGVVPYSHFISCKGDHGHGGSELERSIKGIVEGLQDVYPGHQVILDELGDGTNAYTALELSKRLIPQLLARGCRVLITSHHDAITDYVTGEFGGISLVPDPSGEGKNRFNLVPKAGVVDYEAEKTLDGMGFTSEKFSAALPDGNSDSLMRRAAPVRDDREEDSSSRRIYASTDDIPF